MRGIVQEEKHWESMLKLTSGVEKLVDSRVLDLYFQ